MTIETILSDEIMCETWDKIHASFGRELFRCSHHDFTRAIERAILQSEQVQAWKRDSERLNWLLNNLKGFHAILFDGATPLLYRGRNLKSADALRDEIDAAMEKQL